MKIWIDVTGLYYWSGNLTGIQRVMYNLSRELENTDIDSGLFIYNNGIYKALTFSDLNNQIQEKNKKPKSPVQNYQASYLNARNIIYYILVKAKKVGRGSFMEPQLRYTYELFRRIYRCRIQNTHHPKKSNIFNKGDIVLIIDGNWQYKGFENSIIAEKHKHSFFLYHMVHDLNAWKNPALCAVGASETIGDYFKKIFKYADGLIAISESTKHDIEFFLKDNNISNKPKLFSITLGMDMGFGSGQKPLTPALLPKDFILSVSTIEIRKNYLLFYYIYNLAFQKKIKLPHLIIVGRRGWMAEEAYNLLTKDPKINENVTICDNIKDNELIWLYKNCMYSVFPSFYEGWGLPVAESLAYSKCCISSNTSFALKSRLDHKVRHILQNLYQLPSLMMCYC